MAELTGPQRAFLDEKHLGTIGTINKDTSPQLTALWYQLRGNEIIMNTGQGTKKVRNLKRDKRASFIVVADGRHVNIEGAVTLDAAEATVLADLTALASRYAGAEAGPGIAANIAKIPHVTLRLSIDKVRTFGKFE
ncbi:MAG TPA: PPOX class F420-dependent oxidoreductase [Chloroflexota bacterium]|nr:PPOX class F420-dependent oxidoreductase [Chloroflexota bacterium]